MAGKSTSGRHSDIYILTLFDKYELPILIGDKNEIAQYTESQANIISVYAKKGMVLKRKYKVFKYEEELAF